MHEKYLNSIKFSITMAYIIINLMIKFYHTFSIWDIPYPPLGDIPDTSRYFLPKKVTLNGPL